MASRQHSKKNDDLLLLGLLLLAFAGKGPLATPPDATGARPSGDTSSADPSRPTSDPSTGRPNNDNTEVPDPSGANTKSAPPVDPMSSGNGNDKSNAITPAMAPPPSDTNMVPIGMVFGGGPFGPIIPVDIPPKYPSSYTFTLGGSPAPQPMPPPSSGAASGDISGRLPSPLAPMPSLFSMIMGGLGDLGKMAANLLSNIPKLGAPVIGGIPEIPPIIPNVFAESQKIPDVNAAQAAARMREAALVMSRPDLTYSTGFAGGLMGPKGTLTEAYYMGAPIGQFTRNSPQEAIVKNEEAERAYALATKLGYETANNKFRYYDARTMMYI